MMRDDPEEICAKRFLVHGRVQGVFFRASARQEAERLGLSGHVANLPDGRVEVVAAGTRDQMREFESWLWQGPPQAHVDEVVSEDYPGPVPAGFRIR